jgi:hypothetical protein
MTGERRMMMGENNLVCDETIGKAGEGKRVELK